MPISTEAQELTKFYEQKIGIDTEQLNQLIVVSDTGYDFRTGAGETEGIKIYASQEMLDLFGSLINPLDTQIIQINTQINTLQQQILSVGQQANAIGCGGTGLVGFTTITVYEDRVKYDGYKFSGKDPFESIEGTLNTGNVGVGTFNYITQVAIGSYFGPVGQCNIFAFLGCVSNGDCEDFVDTINNLEQQIDTLQNTRVGIINDVNPLKEERIRYELQDYAYRKSKQNLQADIANSQAMINILQSY